MSSFTSTCDCNTSTYDCCLTTPRWKTLTISESKDIHPHAGPTGDYIMMTMCHSYNLQFLRLHELHITDYQSIDALVSDYELRFKPTWPSPNLCILCCKGFVPLPSSPFFSSLSSFSIALYASPVVHPVRLQDVFSFLASTLTITDLDLEIPSLAIYDIQQPAQFGILACQSITSF